MISHPLVDCRIGSLETTSRTKDEDHRVDCRIGSLEKEGGYYWDSVAR